MPAQPASRADLYFCTEDSICLASPFLLEAVSLAACSASCAWRAVARAGGAVECLHCRGGCSLTHLGKQPRSTCRCVAVACLPHPPCPSTMPSNRGTAGFCPPLPALALRKGGSLLPLPHLRVRQALLGIGVLLGEQVPLRCRHIDARLHLRDLRLPGRQLRAHLADSGRSAGVCQQSASQHAVWIGSSLSPGPWRQSPRSHHMQHGYRRGPACASQPHPG